MSTVILLALLLLICLLSVPVCYAIGASSIIFLVAEDLTKVLQILPQRIWNGAFSFTLICMPLFIFAGELMNTGGITRRIFDFCMQILRPIRGGIAEVNVVDSMLFGGISGSSVADVCATGGIMLPEMERQGFDPKFAAGLTVATSTMGMIIPPSIPMIVYSMVSSESIAGLFLAGLLPGLTIGLVQFIFVYTICEKRGYHGKKVPFEPKKFWKAFWGGLPSLLLPVFIIGSISFGIVTATESAAIAVLYALFVGACVHRELTLRHVWQALKKTLLMSSSIMIIIGFSMCFSYILTLLKVPAAIGNFFAASTLPKWVLLLFVDVLLLFLGCFLDVSPCILMLSPVMLPAMKTLGVSGLQFGVILITGMAIGLCTPPVGMCLNACSKLNKMSIMDIFKGALPFLMCNVLALLAVTFIPALSTWLPSLL